jgi:hypothetical protein
VPSVEYSITRPYQRAFGDPISRPMLLVRIRNGSRRTSPILALVDSGADVSTFHPVVAAQVGVDPSACRAAETGTAGGRVRIAVCSIELEVEGHIFAADVHFSWDMPATMALLGRHDVFRQFQFGFDERAERLLICPYS